MKTNDKWIGMNVFLEKEEKRKFTQLCLSNTTFPHRVLVEAVKHYNKAGLPKWLIQACIRGHAVSVRLAASKAGRPKKVLDNGIK